MSDRGLVLGAVALALAPWAVVKLLLLAALGAGLAARCDGAVSWRERRVRGTLVALGAAALVASPYWTIAPTPILRGAGFAANAALVLLWARRAAAPVEARPARLGAAAAFAIATGLLLVSGPGLFAPIEFRGDEDVHLTRPLRALEAFQATAAASPRATLAASCVAAGALAGLALLRRLGRSVLVSALALPLLAWLALQPPPREMLLRLARYPILAAWLHAVAAFSPLDALPAAEHALHEEALFRLVPFASALVLALLAARALKGPPLLRVCGGLLVGTAPTVVYFSSSLYPDLTAATAVTAALLLLAARRDWLRPAARAGVAMLSIGLLLKETFLPAGLAAAAVGAVPASVAHGSAAGSNRRWRRALELGFLALAPLAAYLAWRVAAGEFLHGQATLRTVSPDPLALANPVLLPLLATALGQQLGALLPLAVLGLAVAPPRTRLLLAAAAVAPLPLFATDSVRLTALGPLPAYWGHARFLLAVLPSAVCLTVVGLRFLWRRARILAWLALGLGLAAHLVARPVAWDGSRPPFWGDTVAETSGERYPYDALYAWLRSTGERRELTIVGRDYDYRDDFYLARFGLGSRVVSLPAAMPRSPLVTRGGPDPALLLEAHRAALEGARSAAGPVVLHVSAWLDPDTLPSRLGELRRIRDFRLGRHSLVLYRPER